MAIRLGAESPVRRTPGARQKIGSGRMAVESRNEVTKCVEAHFEQFMLRRSCLKQEPGRTWARKIRRVAFDSGNEGWICAEQRFEQYLPGPTGPAETDPAEDDLKHQASGAEIKIRGLTNVLNDVSISVWRVLPHPQQAAFLALRREVGCGRGVELRLLKGRGAGAYGRAHCRVEG
jgi:hypothetical protein